MRTYIAPFFLTLAILASGCGSDIPAQNPIATSNFTPQKTYTIHSAKAEQWYDAIGTVAAKTEADIEAQVTAKITKVHVRAGDTVSAGQTLIELDSRQAEAGLAQAKQQLEAAISRGRQSIQTSISAKANFDKAKATFERMKKLFSENVITKEELEKSETSYTSAKANYAASRDGLNSLDAQVKEAEERYAQAKINLDYTKIKAPEQGKVSARLAEKGDLAFPGKPLIKLQTSGTMQLTAFVREGLIGSIKIGDTLTAAIDALDLTVETTVEEIQPVADPSTRSFQVKASLPIIAGIYPGMFGRLQIPEGKTETILIPESFITRTGQLETVLLQTQNGWIKQYVRSGRIFDNGTRFVEILSGISNNDVIGGEMKSGGND